MKFKPFLALEASAGSGKTFALSVRFVALILMGAKMNEILALTFTKKATNEMQKRVIETFLNFENKEAECTTLCEFLGKDKNELIKIRNARKEEFLRQNLRIFTFDAFFAQILRAFALNLGLMSDFSASDNELDVRSVFLKLLEQGELKSLAHYIVRFDERESFFAELEKLYHNAYKAEIKEAIFPNQNEIQKAYSELRNFIPSLENVLNSSNFKNLSNTFENPNFASLDLDEFLKKPFMQTQNLSKYLEKLLNENPEFHAKREAFFKALNLYANALESFKISKLLILLEKFSKAKDFIHKSKNTLSFADITKKVYELVMSDFKELIYFRLDGRISHLLIDEFQDTSVIQYQILKPIIAELVSGEGVKKFRSFFYVGDKKQSIYRFRNGKKELFELLQKEFRQIECESLDTNYRSEKILVDFVNATFKDKFTDYKEQKVLAKNTTNQGFVRIVQSEEQDKDEIKEQTLKSLLKELLFLQSKGVAWEEICILCWKNQDSDAVLDFLRKQNIPAFTQSNILLENKASVRLVLEYAKFCVFGDAFYSEFIKELLGEEPLRLKLDLEKSAAANVLYLAKNLKLDLSDMSLLAFIEYAHTKQNFLELLFEPCTLKIINEQSFGVSIMSVHKSKGLEFEHVILLDRLSKPQPNNESIMLEFDIAKGWELKMRDKLRKQTQEPFYTAFLEQIQKAERDDDLNKIYVALTRAKSSLIIIKRNANSVDGQNPSYFTSNLAKKTPFIALLELDCQELGELSQKTPLNLEPTLQTKNELEKFERVEKQELEPKESLNSKEIYFGNAFHFFMQNIKFDGSNYENISQKTRANFHHFLDENAFLELFKRTKNLLEKTEFLALLQNKKLLKEQPLSFDGNIYRLDLLALDEKEAVVIDYKTGQSFSENHKEQVKLYKKAVSEITKMPTKAFIVYVLETENFLCEV